MFEKSLRFLLVLAFAPSAFAATLFGNPGGVGSLNAFIFGNANTDGGHSDGGVVVGGDWSGTRYEIRQHGSSGTPGAPFESNTALYLRGANKLSGDASNTLRVLNGDAYTARAPVRIETHNGRAVQQSVDLTSAVEALKTLSSDLFKLQGTQQNTSDPNNLKITREGAVSAVGVYVFTLDASALTGHKTLDFLGFDSSDLILINVTGSSKVNWSWSTNYDPGSILWNFSTTEISINDRNFFGSILAPNAVVSQRQNIDGTLIAAGWNVSNNVELHYRPFQGFVDLPPSTSDPDPSPVPDGGSTLLLAGLSVGALFAAKRKSGGKVSA